LALIGAPLLPEVRGWAGVVEGGGPAMTAHDFKPAVDMA
jgi:hypothetical protein